MLSAVSKFFRSAAVELADLARGFVMVWIASKYASNCGIGLPSASTKSPSSRPS
jgi:hypothetical protein